MIAFLDIESSFRSRCLCHNDECGATEWTLACRGVLPIPGQSVNRLVTRYARDVRVSLPDLRPPVGHAVFRPRIRATAPPGMSWRGLSLPSRRPGDRNAVRQRRADHPAFRSWPGRELDRGSWSGL